GGEAGGTSPRVAPAASAAGAAGRTGGEPGLGSASMPAPLPPQAPIPPRFSYFDRGESLDDEAFNASLDALLKEASGGDGGAFDLPGGDDVDVEGGGEGASTSASLEGFLRAAAARSPSPPGGGSRKRRKAGSGPGAEAAPSSSATGAGAAAALTYSSRGIVQLPSAFASQSQPTSVAAAAGAGTAGGTSSGAIPGSSRPDLFSYAPPPSAQPYQVHGGGQPLSAGATGLMSTMDASAQPSQPQHRRQQQQQQQQQQQHYFPDFQPSPPSQWETVAASAAASLGFPSQVQVPSALGASRVVPASNSQGSSSVAPSTAEASSLAATASSSLAAKVGSLTNPPRKPSPQSSLGAVAAARRPSLSSSRKRASVHLGGGTNLLVSEDESERRKRRSERNVREQERSQRIAERIAELRTVLAEAGVRFKPDRYSTLVGVVDYIKSLQGRSRSLDEEHRKLLDTIAGADRLANGQGGADVGSTACLQTHRPPASAPDPRDREAAHLVGGIDYRSVFAGCGAPLAIASVDGRFADCNEEFLKATDYTREELMGRVPRRGSKSRNNSRPSGPGKGGASEATSAADASAGTAKVAAAGTPVAKDPPEEDGRAGPERRASGDGPPMEIRVRKPHHLSLFNLLGGEDMETVYAAMSRMLRAPAGGPGTISPLALEVGGGGGPGRGGVGGGGGLPPRKDRGDSGGTSSSSDDCPVESDLTRSTGGYTSGTTSASSGGDGTSDPLSGGGARGTVGGLPPPGADQWTGKIKHTRRKNQMLQLNISLVRTPDGRPKFFNCALSQVE
ncbi:hypothetical protein ACHAWF_017255, partial [Thalassiosira exigua]